MKTVIVGLGKRSYPICIGSKIEGLGNYMKRAGFAKKVLVITNPKIKNLYYSALALGLKKAGFDVSLAIIGDGEKYKNLRVTEKLYSIAVKAGIDRRSCVIALGGGVVGDITGFFAATYLRGIPFIQVPTTLLAMVDSSVGGKTGVNLPEGKNLVGCFYQPRLVWIDISTLKTLPKKEMYNGMAEVIKYGIIKDKDFFKYLRNKISTIYDIQYPTYENIIERCCRIKAQVVGRDEREEKGIREILNFGHTYGHAVETLSGYGKYSHGEAVAIGMAAAGKIANKLKVFSSGELEKMENLLKQAHLPVSFKSRHSFNQVLSILKRDKKVIAEKLRFVLPKKIGSVFIHKGVSPKTVKEVIK